MWKALKTELITQLNVLFTMVLVWVSQQQNTPVDPIVNHLPASVQPIARIVLPILVGIVVQFAVQLLKKRTEAETIDKMTGPAA